MTSITVYHYDAFSKEPNKGNPAGVVLDSEELTETQMQEIAYKVGFNETAFPVASDIADLKIRFFTPGHEMDLCGHATIATMYALKTKGMLGEKTNVTIETRAGILPVSIQSVSDSDVRITMNQASPIFEEFKGSRKEVAHSIGIEETDISDTLPILYGSTGTWTLLLPIKHLAAFQKMTPHNEEFPTILKERPRCSVHPFCTKTYDEQADKHARHFSSPFSGTIEDAVTGTASGVRGAYFAAYIHHDFKETLHLMVEQGHEIEKNGQVKVKVSKGSDSHAVEITGQAVYVTNFPILLDT